MPGRMSDLVLHRRPASEPPPSTLFRGPIPGLRSQTLTGSGTWSRVCTSLPNVFHSYSSVSKSTMTQLITFRKVNKTYPKCIPLWKEQPMTSKTDKSRSCSTNVSFSISDKKEKKWMCLEDRSVWIGNALSVCFLTLWMYCFHKSFKLQKRKTHTHKASNKPKTIIKSI